MQQVRCYVSTIGGRKKLFESQKECEQYELSMQEYIIIDFVLKHIKLYKDTTSMTIDSQTMEITHSTESGDNGWSGRPPIRNVYKYTVKVFIDRYKSEIKDLLSRKQDDENLHKALCCYCGTLEKKIEVLSLIDILKAKIEMLDKCIKYFDRKLN